MGVDSPDVVITKRLLDHTKLRGFAFQRTTVDEAAPLIGKRVGSNWIDIVHIAGFSRDCLTTRQRTLSLLFPGRALVVQRRVEGSALDVPKDLLVHTG